MISPSPLAALAPRPPLGWNSFICYGAAVTEAQFKANVDVFAARLKPAGYEYCVVDFCWSHPTPGNALNPNQEPGFQPRLDMDEFGRLLPSPGRFPSAAGGAGLKPLADYTHAKGLKFGLHIMRGIPRQAVAADTPVKGSQARASQIADRGIVCKWLNHMYSVDTSKDGGQAYYDSLCELYASWGVDYIKADDMSSGASGAYHAGEIAALRRAIDRCGRPMVLSLSPGGAPLSQHAHLAANANLWRISADFWDRWEDLKDQFHLCNAWSPFIQPGGWPDADMVPIGRLSIGSHHGPERDSFLTEREKRTLLTLWAMCRSPLMLGADLTQTAPGDFALLTNSHILHINQKSRGNRQVHRQNELVTWIAEDEAGSDRFFAVFNIGEHGAEARIDLAEIGCPQGAHFTELWTGVAHHQRSPDFTVALAPHDCAVYRLRRA